MPRHRGALLLTTHAVRRRASITIPIALALFVGGGAAGVALARAVAPGSVVGILFGLFMLPAAFTGGVFTWLGLGVLDAIGQSLRRRRGASATTTEAALPASVPSGSLGFVFVSLGVSALVGFALAFLSMEMKFSRAWALSVLVGGVYGVLCWLLARSGYLPFPDGDPA